MNTINAINLIRRALSNRMAGLEIDWEGEDIYKLVKKYSEIKPVSVFTGDELGLEDDIIYCFVFVNSSKTNEVVKKAPDVIESYFKDNELIERVNDGEKIVFYVITNEIKDKIDVEINWKTIVDNIKSKICKGSKLNCETAYIISNSKKNGVYEFPVDRYSLLQEPELINSINLKALAPEKYTKVGYVTSIDLCELIKLYNEMGDCLFDDNVRYAIPDQLGVNIAIRNTLEKEPDNFWYRNNGITILVKSDKFGLDHPNKIVLRKNNNETFSVVNGAQTISVASSYYYELIACQKKDEDILANNFSDDDEKKIKKKEELEKTIKDRKKIIDSFKKARVLLRIIWNKNDNSAESRSISVALNRQKPIKQEDIAYTLDYVSDISKKAQEFEDDRFKFNIIKRGGNEVDSVDLIELSKIRLACMGEPLRARNEGVNKTLKIVSDKDKKHLVFNQKQVFPEIDRADDFKKYYYPVRIARDLAYYYGLNIPEFKKNYNGDKNKEKELNLITNARWFMISHLIIYINDEGGKDDYTHFDEKYEKLGEMNQERVYRMMEEYYNQLASKITEDIDNKFFKKMNWYTANKDKIDIEKVLNA